MKRSKRMQSVANIAKNKERDAARMLGQKRQQLEQQRQRLDELVSYREEYARKFESQGVNGLDARRLHEYRVFLQKLNQAIVQQRDRINQVHGECTIYQESWLSTRVHSKAMDKVVDRCRVDENKIMERQEQKELDERAMQLGLVRDSD